MAKLNVFVSGATGQQGGALTNRLLARGHHVTALTRNPDSAAAGTLKERGVEIISGKLEEVDKVSQAASGADAFFLVTTPFEEGMEAETRQGVSGAEAARKAGVKHLVFNSVASADQETGIPHFDSKFKVEQHIKSLGVPYTIVAPVFFFENLLAPWALEGMKQGALALALSSSTKLQSVAVQDIAAFDLHVIENSDRFLGSRIDIASDSLTGPDYAEVISQAAGTSIGFMELPIEKVRENSEDMALMFEWFEKVGYSVDIEKLRTQFADVGWTRFSEWARARDWSVLAKSETAMT